MLFYFLVLPVQARLVSWKPKGNSRWPCYGTFWTLLSASRSDLPDYKILVLPGVSAHQKDPLLIGRSNRQSFSGCMRRWTHRVLLRRYRRFSIGTSRSFRYPPSYTRRHTQRTLTQAPLTTTVVAVVNSLLIIYWLAQMPTLDAIVALDSRSRCFPLQNVVAERLACYNHAYSTAKKAYYFPFQILLVIGQ